MSMAIPMPMGSGLPPGTAMRAANGQIVSAEGGKTYLIYELIREQKYAEAVELLKLEVTQYPRSRAALSLLAHCYYYLQNFHEAASTYETLVRFFPFVPEYRVYHAQMLFKAGILPEATRAAAQVNEPEFKERMQYLQAAIMCEQGNIQGCKAILDRSPPSAAIEVGRGCLLYKEGNLDAAREQFVEAKHKLGYQPDLAFNIALCYYKQKQYGPALKNIAEIIERGVREHPELSVGSNVDGVEVKSVGNTAVLKETALIEAFNLKAAIEYSLENADGGREALADMPPRSEEELDPVTLHNQALVNMEKDPNGGFKKLNFLLQQPPFPPETFFNLLLLYIKYDLHNLAADVLAENMHLHASLSQEMFNYLEAVISAKSDPAEAFRKLDILSNRHIESLRRFTKKIQDARIARDNTAIKSSLKQYDDALESYIPVLMSQCRIYWDRENWVQVEKIFKQSAEFCADHDTWKLNVAHVFFMQETKFKDAIRYYEPIVKKHVDSLLDIQAIVLANLCVAYIMTSQNDEAEDLMRQIEKEEERLAYEDPSKQLYHLCIVNLVIGTLYCSKGNFTFGLQRIIKSLEPYKRKLGPDTWYYAKRCLVAHIEALGRQMIVLKDEQYEEVKTFLSAVEQHGREVCTIVGNTTLEDRGKIDMQVSNASYEARLLKRLYMMVME